MNGSICQPQKDLIGSVAYEFCGLTHDLLSPDWTPGLHVQLPTPPMPAKVFVQMI